MTGRNTIRPPLWAPNWKKAKDAEFAELQENLQKGHREAIEEAKKHPPPSTVLAYRAVFNRDPAGWPPREEVC